MQVLVTGAAGCLGRVLLPALLADGRIDTVIGHDWRKPTLRHPRLSWRMGDIRDPTLGETVKSVDAVIHMAFVVIEGSLGKARHDRAIAEDINLNGIKIILAALKPRARLIHLSSASVYGTSEHPLTESAPLTPLADFAYAHDKVRVEQELAYAEADGLNGLRLRPHIILGPHAQPFLRGVLRLPFFPRLPHPRPRFQLVHEADVAAAILSGLFSQTTGAINLASNDSLSFEEIQRIRHRIVLGIQQKHAQTLAKAAFQYLSIGPNPAWSAGLNHSLVLNCTRAHTELNWEPRFPQIADILKTF